MGITGEAVPRSRCKDASVKWKAQRRRSAQALISSVSRILSISGQPIITIPI